MSYIYSAQAPSSGERTAVLRDITFKRSIRIMHRRVEGQDIPSLIHQQTEGQKRGILPPRTEPES